MKHQLKELYLGMRADLLEYRERYQARTVHMFNKHQPYGGVTVVYRPQLADSCGRPQGRFAEVAVAWCNPSDCYDRKLGELIALRRLELGECILMPIYDSEHPVRLLKALFGFWVDDATDA